MLYVLEYECKVTILQHNEFKYGVAKPVGSSDLSLSEMPAHAGFSLFYQKMNKM